LSRKAGGLLAAVVVVVVAAVVAATMWIVRSGGSERHEATANPPPLASIAPPAPDNPNNLTADDIDLLKLAANDSYNRIACRHFDTNGLAKAIILCDPNPSTGAPNAAFYSFSSVDQLHTFFANYTKIADTTSCPGDPPGPNGPAKNGDGKEVGRRACYLNKLGREPVPTTIVSHESTLVIGEFKWNGPDGAEGLNNWVYGTGSTDGGLPDKPTDPDVFTPADLDLLSRFSQSLGTNAGYTTANCRHMDPVLEATAQLFCASNPETGFPNAVVLGYVELVTVQALTPAIESKVAHGCGAGGPPTSEVWILHGRNVGRHLCLAASLFLSGLGPAIFVTDESKLWAAEFSSDADGFPYQVPRNERALLEWFNKLSG
jgi:serine/threonine-protein kinase